MMAGTYPVRSYNNRIMAAPELQQLMDDVEKNRQPMIVGIRIVVRSRWTPEHEEHVHGMLPGDQPL